MENVARVFPLDADERAHLFMLAREHVPADPLLLTQIIDSTLQLMLETMGISPAWVLNMSWESIAWNHAACRMLGDVGARTSRERHLLWLLFPDPRSHAIAVDWEQEAQRFLARFRASIQRSIGEAWMTTCIHDLEQVRPA